MMQFFYILAFGLIFISTMKTDAPGPCEQDFGDSGMCEAYIPSYSYDFTTGECLFFVYGGCGGNENRFTSWFECNHICIEGGEPKQEGQGCYSLGLGNGGCDERLYCNYIMAPMNRMLPPPSHPYYPPHPTPPPPPHPFTCQEPKQEGQGCLMLGLDNGGCDEGLYCNYNMAPMNRMLSPPPLPSHSSPPPPPFTCLVPRKEGEECHTDGFEEGGCGRGLICLNDWQSQEPGNKCKAPKRPGESCDFTEQCDIGLECIFTNREETGGSCLSFECWVENLCWIMENCSEMCGATEDHGSDDESPGGFEI